jgi:hypothetical protein
MLITIFGMIHIVLSFAIEYIGPYRLGIIEAYK